LFIHGLGSSTGDWGSQVAESSRNCQVVSLDLRGHRRSDRPAGHYSIASCASDTTGLVRALGLDSAHVVGISLGGGVAFQLAIDSPYLVKTLTIVNGALAMRGSSERAKAEIDRRVGMVRQTGMRSERGAGAQSISRPCARRLLTNSMRP
jgi:3-oxoadipate enol-lactonase